MDICNNVGRMRLLAERHREEDFDFRAWLEQGAIPDLDLDAMVSELTLRAMAQVDCIGCHNCCIELQPQATKLEVEKLAGYLGVCVDEFQRKHVDDAPLLDSLIRKSGAAAASGLACSLLCEGRCTVYEVRPECCRKYPHLLDSGFRSRLWSVGENCHICPVVFNVQEEMKRILWHHPRRHAQKSRS